MIPRRASLRHLPCSLVTFRVDPLSYPSHRTLSLTRCTHFNVQKAFAGCTHPFQRPHLAVTQRIVAEDPHVDPIDPRRRRRKSTNRPPSNLTTR